MIKQILYFILFISAYDVMAQTIPKDTLQPTATPTVLPVETTQPTVTTPTTVTTETIQPTSSTTATQTVQPTTITTQTLHPTMPNIKHRRKKSETFEKENKELVGLYDQGYDKKSEIILQNKRYRIYNNYITAGVGKCYNSGWDDFETTLAVDYNFHLKRNRFQLGAMLVGPNLSDNNVVQFHAGYGYRVERCNYFWAAYGGLSYSDGYRLNGADSVRKFTTIGAYANLQFFYKLKFDYGIGASAFVDGNSKQALLGIKIELFLSGAYKGLKKINYTKEEEKER